MIQKIIDAVTNKTSTYNEVIEAEKILKILLTFLVIDKLFEIKEDEEKQGVWLSQDASVFAKYLKEQLDLYVEDNQVQLFIFSSLMANYFSHAKHILDSSQFSIIISADSDGLYDMIRERLKPELVDLLRNIELFFKGVENEKV